MRLRAGESLGGARAAAVGLRSRSAVAVGALLLFAGAGGLTVWGATAPCVPPRMPPIAEWRALGAQSVVLEGAAGLPPTFGVAVDYRVGPQRVRGVWVGRDLVVVDPDVDDLERPVWRDRGALGADGRATGRAPTCDWVEDSGRRA